MAPTWRAGTSDRVHGSGLVPGRAPPSLLWAGSCQGRLSVLHKGPCDVGASWWRGDPGRSKIGRGPCHAFEKALWREVGLEKALGWVRVRKQKELGDGGSQDGPGLGRHVTGVMGTCVRLPGCPGPS